MKLSISNIGWTEEMDRAVYGIMHELGFTGLEIAPTRIFPKDPYEQLEQAECWADSLRTDMGFTVSSMQSIWYGRQEKLFGSEAERDTLSEYTKAAIIFAQMIGCKNLVFGCPRNRNIPEGGSERTALRFFREMGDFAASHGTVIGMEANPPIYNTNYINDTGSALELIENVGSEGFKLNLDVGTMIENGESVSVLQGKEHLINHVHISEPGLKPIERRDLHQALSEMLRISGYNGFVSIEAGKREDVDEVKEMMQYVKAVFGDA